MTIDERLEKLAERHEALAQSVEMLTADARELVSAQKRFEDDMRERIAALLDNNNRLSTIIIAHDEPLDDHDRRLGDLEGGPR
jgi:hypothetical protein